MPNVATDTLALAERCGCDEAANERRREPDLARFPEAREREERGTPESNECDVRLTCLGKDPERLFGRLWRKYGVHTLNVRPIRPPASIRT
jgi:hypothetical protein